MLESIQILEKLKLPYDYYEHEPILNYDTTKKVDERYHLTGVESKNLFIKTKSSRYYVLVTMEGVRLNSKFMKELLGEKVSIASSQELMDLCGYEAGCAASFPYAKEIGYLVDNALFTHDKIICSAGIPTASFEMPTENLKVVYQNVENEVRYIDLPKDI